MSRGHGSTQRKVLDAACDQWVAVVILAERISGGAPAPRATVESVRRACRRLADEGLLELDYVSGRRWDDLYVFRRSVNSDRPDRPQRRWSDVIAEEGYEPDAKPSHPTWQLAVRRIA
jgi:hypothetical protein